MPQLSPSQARLIDPILSSVAQGFQNSAFVGGLLFPTVGVAARGGRILSFGKEAFMLYTNTQRAPGENTKRIQVGFQGSPFSLLDYSLESSVPRELLEEASAVPGIDLASASIKVVSDALDLRLEKQQADLARNPANYSANNKITLSGTFQWSDFGTTSDPVAVVEAAREAIRTSTGKRPNTMVIGAAVMAKLKQHPKVVDRMKYTGRDIATTELLQSLFDIARVVIGDGIYALDDGTFVDVWGKDVVLAYTELSSLANMGTPSYGYTYTLDGYPMVEEPYYDPNAKTWFYPYTRVEAPVIAGASAGFLIANAVA
ncbi:major capsid protein [Xylophilus ampelinus]|uniref:Major capsid protein E n=1 Tax=Xylophilus ampelinus TaxID=54067 RepID=A0A318SKH1_9BURK|nr:major capsid protein [Xylophilus ampelinus]MCS4508894.1 major capsid protein [Xylophilus ampelinus]PYE79463.1 major capsid protein E [Xylophilus ampelinus]